MRDRATSGFYQSVSLSQINPPNGRRNTSARPTGLKPNTPQRRTLLGRFRPPGDGESLPSLEAGRRYILFWGVFGVVLATLLSSVWVLWAGGDGSLSLSFPWTMWFSITGLSIGNALWNMWYIKQVVSTQQEKMHLYWQEKHSQNVPKERMFEQLIQAASNTDPAYVAARMNAILRIPDFILSRGQGGSYFRAVGCGLLGTILMELNLLESEGELKQHQVMVKRVTFKALMVVKEHLNGISLQSVNLTGLDLSFANLSGADLTSSLLAEANLEEANLQSASLEYCELQKTNLHAVELQGANLKYAIFYEANLANARLRGANAQHANFLQASMQQADLTEANLREANLQHANLTGAQLRFADLRYASLANANLQGADLEGADLEGADLTDANLEGVRTQGANMPKS